MVEGLKRFPHFARVFVSAITPTVEPWRTVLGSRIWRIDRVNEPVLLFGN